MIYVALLRGINVGGNAKVAMSELKETFEKLSCEQVKTYINSGNVVFSDNRTAANLLPKIEAAISDNFGFEISVVLRDQPNIDALCNEIPESWTNDTTQKTDVIFLRNQIDSPDILQHITINTEIETARYIQGALVWNIAHENASKGSGIKLIKSSIYANMTVRNINTVRKIQALMREIK